MYKFSFFSMLLGVLFVFSTSSKAQTKGYKIDVTIKGYNDTNVFLAHHFAKSMYPDDTVRLDKNGRGVFTKDKPLIQGLYVIFLPNQTYFEIIVGEDQNFSLVTDTTDYLKNLSFKGSPDNTIFLEFQKYMQSKHQEAMTLQEQLKNTESEDEKKSIQESLQKLGEERKAKINKTIENNPELFTSTFLKATLDVEVPDELRGEQVKAYEYYKKHYFDNFDISDVRLLHTPLYEDKLMTYLDKIVIQVPDSIIKEIDQIFAKTQSDSILFRYVLITLFNKYGKSNLMGMDAVQVHIADKYYIPMAYWSSEEFIADLKDRVEKLKPLLIGKVAPDPELRFVPAEHFKDAKNDTALKKYPHAGSFMKISQVNADFTVLLFWEATCSHCKKIVPQVYNIYQESLKDQNVQVVAISTLFGEDGKEKWVDFVNNKQLYDWLNVWNPYDYKYKELFDIRSTPQIFVLNKDKEIIGKKLAPENILELINAYKKHNQK